MFVEEIIKWVHFTSSYVFLLNMYRKSAVVIVSLSRLVYTIVCKSWLTRVTNLLIISLYKCKAFFLFLFFPTKSGSFKQSNVTLYPTTYSEEILVMSNYKVKRDE